MIDQTPVRFLALDSFRGLTLALMILVNTPGSWSHVYAPLLHASWHGLTPTDVVFPCFLFIVGASVYFANVKWGFEFNRMIFRKVLKRSIIMFLIGFALNFYNFVLLDLETFRIMGVLQRIALCYFFGSLLILNLNVRTLYLVALGLLLFYYMLFFVFGGEYPFALQNNLVSRVDTLFLGEQHMWKMQGIAFDPEGLLATMPAVVTLLIGFETARRLAESPVDRSTVLKLLAAGTVLMAIGYACSFAMPINKNLWSVSYVFVTAAWALLVLSVCVWLVDLRRCSRLAKPFVELGTNPLFIYCLSWIAATTLFAIQVETVDGEVALYTWLWMQLLNMASAKLASLLFAIAHVIFFWMVSLVLYRKNIVVKI